ESCQKCRNCCEPQDKQNDSTIDFRRDVSHKNRRKQHCESDESVGEKNPESAPDDAKNGALEKKLPDESSTGCSQSSTDTELTVAGCRPCQHQVRHVGAAHQKDKPCQSQCDGQMFFYILNSKCTEAVFGQGNDPYGIIP